MRISPNRSRSSPNTAIGTKTSTAGDDTATTQAKKRRLSGGNLARGAGSIDNGTSMETVHRLFATEFFSNISKGYDILLHTFQYLKVQVCRYRSKNADHLGINADFLFVSLNFFRNFYVHHAYAVCGIMLPTTVFYGKPYE